MASKMAEDGKRKKTGGRQAGTPNKVRRSVSEVFKRILGVDPDTNEPYGPGLKVRQRLQEMLTGERDPDPAYIRVHAYLMSYAYGMPMRMTADTADAMSRRLAFITARGLPWQQDPLALRESQMIQQQETEAALQLELSAARAADPTAPASEEQKDAFNLSDIVTERE